MRRRLKHCARLPVTGATPHDVGYARGALLIGPRYLNTVKMYSSDIVNGDIDEAIQRLVLVPVTARVYVEFLRGEGEGIAQFEEFLAKTRKKAPERRRNELPKVLVLEVFSEIILCYFRRCDNVDFLGRPAAQEYG